MAKLFFSTMIAMLLLSSVAATFVPLPYPFSRKINLTAPAFGPDSVAFSEINKDIAYVTISDGRVLLLRVKSGIFEDFAYTSAARTKQQCDGYTDPNLAPTCGKVMDVSVDNVNRILYAVDVFLGLFAIQLPKGGQATLITDTAGGQPLRLSNGIDVDPKCGDVYFTDAGQLSNPTGRLIKYNPKTKDVTVLVSELNFPTGPAVSFDGSFVLFPQINGKNIVKYYIKGPKANTTEVLVTLSGFPSKIKRASTFGYFWVHVYEEITDGQFKPIAYKFNSLGKVLIRKDLSEQYPNTLVAVIQETSPLTIFVGSQATNYITEYSFCDVCL